MKTITKLTILWVIVLAATFGVGVQSFAWAMMNFRGETPLTGKDRMLEEIGNRISDIFAFPVLCWPQPISSILAPIGWLISTLFWASCVMIPVSIIVLRKNKSQNSSIGA